MSFDIWISCFRNGEVAQFPRAVVEGALGRLIVQREPRCWIMKSGAIYIDDEEMINGFAVNRPPGDDDFWEGILSILKQSSTVLYWPGEGACVASASVIEQMPPSALESIGTPTVVSTVGEILECIENG